MRIMRYLYFIAKVVFKESFITIIVVVKFFQFPLPMFLIKELTGVD